MKDYNDRNGFHSENYPLEMPRSHAKVVWKAHHKNWTL